MVETKQSILERLVTSKPVRSVMLITSLGFLAGCTKIGGSTTIMPGNFRAVECDKVPTETDMPPDISDLQTLALAKVSTEIDTTICNAANWAASVVVKLYKESAPDISFNDNGQDGDVFWQDNAKNSNGLNGDVTFGLKGAYPNLEQLQGVEVGTNGGYISIDTTQTTQGTVWSISTGDSFGNFDSSSQPKYETPKTQTFNLATQNAIYAYDKLGIYLQGLEAAKDASELVEVESQVVR